MQGLDPDLRALQEVRDCVERAKRACESLRSWDQARTDALVQSMAEAGARAAHDLARLAVEETDIGRVHYKVLKNLFGSEGVWESIREEKTVGVIRRDDRAGVLEIATPVGVVAGIVPTTNPTSTAMGKALIAVKGRNAIVVSPHPRARRCIGETCDVLRRAIERAGGPPDLVQCLSNPTIESTGALMRHRHVSIVLATGGAGLVEAAYSSGTPAYGVGPGNVPCYVDRSADVDLAARTVIASQSFDNATLCCSEQALVLDRPIAERLLAAMAERGAHLCTREETEKLARHCNRRGHMNPDVVGKDPWRIAEGAGFSVPRSTSLLLAEQGGVGREWPLSIEILAPLLSVHRVEGWEDGCRVSMDVLHYGGLGHTCAVWARDEGVLDAWFLEKPANRILANGPASEGAVGYSTGLVPSMSLGCGPQAGNITSDNITARHLINVKRVARPRLDWPEVYRRDHERAAAWTGDRAPRGSGLPGDPALGAAGTTARPAAREPVAGAPAAAGTSAARGVASNWRGNPPVVAPRRAAASSQATAPRKATVSPQATAAPRPRPDPPAPVATAVLPRPAEHTAPRFTEPAPTTAPRAERPAAAAPVKGSHVGDALSAGEIRSILEHAGSGCPLGPCKGCPHLEVSTGACQA